MSKKIANPTTGESTGMMKRSNPLSLAKPEKVSTSSQPSVTLKKSTASSIDGVIDTPLIGPTQWLFFLPLLNKDLLTALKTQFPTLTNKALVEKALLTLLKQNSSTAYDRLLKTLKK